jgi:hypothetical protein
LVRWTLDGWAAGIERDLRRAEAAYAAAQAAAGQAPDDDQVAALEECLWRISTGTEKVDALISLAFNADPIVVVADNPTQITMRPSRDRNKERLKDIGEPSALKLIEARATLSGERSRLRRHQIAHSLPALDDLQDLACFIRVHHRDGRVFGYELVRWTPERWNEGISELTPEALFGQRLEEARRGLAALVRVVEALADVLVEAATVRVPQFVYYDHDTNTYAPKPPSPTGPPKSLEIDFVLEQSDPLRTRRVSSPSLVQLGTEIPFDDGVWRVVALDGGKEGADQTAICRLVGGED